MGLGGISIWQLVIVLAIVLVVFGTKRLKGLGGEVGGAIKGFKQAMNEEPESLEKAESSSMKADVKSTDSVS